MTTAQRGTGNRGRFERYRPYALKIARDYTLPGHDPDDVRQEAVLALWKADITFDATRGVPFHAFAGLVIRRQLGSKVRSALRPSHAILTDATRLDLEPDDDGEPSTWLTAVDPRADVERLVILRDELRRAVNGELTYEERRRKQWRDSKRRARAAA